MRTARIKYQGGGAYYHCINRCGGYADERPLGELEKEMFVKLLRRLDQFYTVEVISYVVMSNHFHVVLYASGKKAGVEETVARYNAYYEGRRVMTPESPGLPAVQDRLCDFSMLMKDLQQLFTMWFNESRAKRRRGRLWGDRFKSVLLDGKTALWSCVKYVELSPVRSGLVNEPGDYRHSSWGAWHGCGRHPCGGAFLRHMARTLGDGAHFCSANQVAAELKGDMARTIAAEQDGATSESIQSAYRRAKEEGVRVASFLRKAAYWSNGAVIGTQGFVRMVAIDVLGVGRAEKRRLCEARSLTGEGFFSLCRGRAGPGDLG